jgi:ESCRT-I complex subunit TSG101
MSVSDLTRDWLQTVLRPYTARERLLNEVLDILKARRTLSIKTEAFSKSLVLFTSTACNKTNPFIAFDSGQTALLLLLHGTLPITFRSATYQIPIHIWIPHDYPRKPPLGFVVPTKEMGVRKGREVEPGGRISDDVVEQWWAGWQVGCM